MQRRLARFISASEDSYALARHYVDITQLTKAVYVYFPDLQMSLPYGSLAA